MHVTLEPSKFSYLKLPGRQLFVIFNGEDDFWPDCREGEVDDNADDFTFDRTVCAKMTIRDRGQFAMSIMRSTHLFSIQLWTTKASNASHFVQKKHTITCSIID